MYSLSSAVGIPRKIYRHGANPMKFSHLRLVLLMVIALFAFGCNGKKVAVVNPDLVYQKSSASEKGSEYIKSVAAELESELRALEKSAEGGKDSKAAQEKLQQSLMGIQQRFNAEQQQVINALTEAYKQALENCRIKFKYDVIITSETAAAFDPAVDVTEKVAEEMSALPLDFKRISLDEPKPENTEAAQPAQ